MSKQGSRNGEATMATTDDIATQRMFQTTSGGKRDVLPYHNKRSTVQIATTLRCYNVDDPPNQRCEALMPKGDKDQPESYVVEVNLVACFYLI